jgi:hypothetical protein
MTPFDDVCYASLPESALPRLAPLRCEPGVQVAVHEGRLWVRFEPGSERVLRCGLPLAGVELFAFRDGAWRRFGESLPAFDFPQDLQLLPLYQALFPAPVLPVPPGAAALSPIRLMLKPDDRPRPTTAMYCSLSVTRAWADTAPATQLERCHGVIRDENVLVVGTGLPVLERSERFWGRLVLAPLGFSPDPDLPETALREAAGVLSEELLLLRQDRAEALPRAAFGPLSRAALRLAVREGTP